VRGRGGGELSEIYSIKLICCYFHLMTAANYYRQLSDARRAVIDENINDSESFEIHVISHNFLVELEALSDLIIGPEQLVFGLACREYQHALEAVLSGSYRHAHASLRLSFELMLGTIYFSAHQLKLNLWVGGHDDLRWAQIADSDNGIFSANFVRAFFADLASHRTQYMSLAAAVYRECSEYVHGNPNTHGDISANISYDVQKARAFHDKVATVRVCMLFAMSVRYLLTASSSSKDKVEGVILDALGNIEEIQAIFEATADE
jgi:hypothetical protein